MCGLAGYYNLSSQTNIIDASLLEQMQQSLMHRGPDGYRIWHSEQHQLGVVHRRLSILDLSDAAFQPFWNAEKNIMVLCNGEIYNHAELRSELEQLGYRYQTQSDTETILYVYQAWGIDGLHKLNGMFAIVIFDLRTQELYLVRDRLGIKPLYFSLQQNILNFASEIKALWCLPWIKKNISHQALYHYLTYMVTPAPMTLYQDIYKLPAGYYLKVDAHKKVTFHEWYNPLQPYQLYHADFFKDETAVINQLRSMLRASVQQQMLSDVPYGVFLSGGIDSSLNVALMSEFTDRVKTFTVAFSDGPEYDELVWARTVAKKFNTEHHEITINEQDAFNFYEKMVHHQDEPLADCVCIPLYYVAKLLKDSGVTVVQVGEGSDELFCGYSSYANYIDFYQKYWQKSQQYIPAFLQRNAYNLFSLVFLDRIHQRDLLKKWSSGQHLFWSGAIAFPELLKKDFLCNQDLKSDAIITQIYPELQQNYNSYAIPEYHLQQLYKQNSSADFLTSMIYLELKQRLPELLLMRVDKMTMATSVEGRVPFLDHRLVEFALQMPSVLKYKNGMTKYILKKAAEDILPHDIIYRKKMGFAAPTARWFKHGTYFKSYFMDILQTKREYLKDYLHLDAVTKLFNKNVADQGEYSVQLWTLQNFMALKL